MTNDYFNHDVPLARQTVARAEGMNDIFTKIQAGFEKMPGDAVIKEGRITYGIDSGTANSYQVTMPHARTALVDGMQVVFRALHANSGIASLDLDGLGAVPMRRPDGRDLIAGDIPVNAMVECRYDELGNFWAMTSQTDTDRRLAEGAAIGAASARDTAIAARDGMVDIRDDAFLARDEAKASRDEALAAAAGVSLPPITPADVGHVLTPKPDASGYELRRVSAEEDVFFFSY